MSKEGLTCKISALYKHKERKPKKPHYIPRPWGKPYNYKCFQCPFTCMEKSHLYNHMKYSLCKNSLSLLIESDWPYKKSNVLHSDLRLLQEESVRAVAGMAGTGRGGQDSVELGEGRRAEVGEGRRAEAEVEAEDITIKPDALGCDCEAGVSEIPPGDNSALAAGSGRGTGRGRGRGEEEEEEEREARGLPPEIPPAPRSAAAAKADRKAEADIIIMDVFSLKDSAGTRRALPTGEPDTEPRRHRLPKGRGGAGNGGNGSNGGILMEKWRLVASGHRKTPAAFSSSPSRSSPPCADANVIPCYPPPAALGDYQEPPGLNLSVLGVNYPVNHGLFSYLSPAIAGQAAPAHMAQLPFLASSAQLVHPHPHPHPHPHGHLQSVVHLSDRTPHHSGFFYPLLFEHTFGPGEGRKSGPATPRAPAASRSPDGPGRTRPREAPALAEPPAADVGRGERRPAQPGDPAPAWRRSRPVQDNARDAKAVTPAAPPAGGARAAGRNQEGRTSIASGAAGGSGDVAGGFLDKPSRASVDSVPPGSKHHGGRSPQPPSAEKGTQQHNSCQPAVKGKVSPPPHKPLSHWSPEPCVRLKDPPDSPPELGSPSPPASPPRRNPAEILQPGEEGEDGSTVLIDDLCKVIHEYREVEEQLCLLDSEARPGQRPLRSQLAKIREELLHIRRALQKMARQPEGPLDLSVKRSLDGMAKSHKRSGGERGGGGGGGCLDNRGPLISPVDEAQPVDGCKESRVGSWTTGSSSSPRPENRSTPDVAGGRTREAGDLPTAAVSAERGEGTAEVKPGGGGVGGGGGGGGSEVPKDWPTLANRTTKCEADSSVPLGVDGRLSSQPGRPYPGPEDGQPPRCQALKRSLSGECQSEREKRSRLSPMVGERLTAIKQSRVV